MSEVRLDSATAIASSVRDGSLRAADVVEASLGRIADVEPRIAAFLEVHEDDARQRAAALDAARDRGEALGPLAGVPVALKDNFVRRGFHTTCGSKILDGFVSPYSATAVERLEAAGAIVVGRTNMDEFGMGSSTEHSIFGATKNPFDLERTPGGSSGGSAAAVAARAVPLALGSDTGGSVRQPASLCGINGLKPTYGRVSRFGLVAYASSLDTVSTFATDADDLALTLSVLAGVDAHDSTSLDAPVPSFDGASVEGTRIGVPREFFAEGLDTEVEATTRRALDALRELGAELVDVSLPHARFAIPTYYLIAMAEASSNLSRFDGVRYGLREGGDEDLTEMYVASRSAGFGAEVRRRILLGCYCLRQGYAEEWYEKAQKVRTLIRRDFDAAFEACDVMACPTSPTPAFKLGEKVDDPLALYLCDTLTTPANLAGIPGLSIPCGRSAAGLPIGLQLMAPALEEARLFRAARAFQAATDFHREEPAL